MSPQNKLIAIFTLVLVVLVAAVSGASYYAGYSKANSVRDAEALAQANRNAEKLAAIQAKSENQTRALQDEINKLKAGNTLPDRALLVSPDFCRLYDSAAGFPETACQESVTLEAVADTTKDNFAACRQNIIWLEECQAACR